ncbi:MAG: putative LPS assembly protein LptD [Candidatus Neomarinimicrobiota bacterium]
MITLNQELGELLPVIRTITSKVIQGLICTAIMVAVLQAAQGDERLRLVSADIFENVQIDGKTVQILSGSVVFRKGDMELRTAQARYYRAEGRTRLMGSVIMIRPGERLTCDTLVFFNAEDRIAAEGNVRFEQTNQTVESRELNYWTKLDSGIARHDVVMTQEDRQLTADEFHTWKTTGPREASFQAYGSVIIDESGRRISGDLMRYDDDEATLHLIGEARLHEGNRDLRGEIIRLVYEGEILKNGYIEQGAEASSLIRARMSPEAKDTRLFTDLLTSRTMEGTFTDEKLSQLELRGMASSIFHVIEDSVLQGVNNATGDTIGLAFDSLGNLNRITVRGGARGRFVPEPGNSEVDTLIDYKAEFIDYHILDEITYMEKGARVDYRENGLFAGNMVLTWQDNILRAEEAYGEPPTLYQARRDPMVGERMEFDLIAERGRILKGRTKLDNGYYHGVLVHRYPENVYYVKQSKYTTCDLDHPHFYFASSRMKMLQGDKVIAKPIILYLADLPLIGLPFAVFPNKAGGRLSGLIMPGYGESRNHGQYLDGLGYFWAINSYADATTLLDFYDRRGVLVKGQFRYKKLYKFDGNLRSTYNREVAQNEIANLLSQKTTIKWDLKWIHNHTIDPTQRLNINATYTSNPRMYRDLGKTLETRLKQQVVSNASYTKNWRGAGASFKLALSERYDLLAEGKLDESPHDYGQKIEERTRTLPLIGFSLNQRALIKSRKGQEQKWYHKINYSFRNNLNNRQSIFWEADSVTSDSLYWPVERTVLNRSSATNNISLSTQQNVFKYLSTTLSLGIVQAWTPTYRRARTDASGNFQRDDNDMILFDEVERITPRHTGQLSLRAQTNLYGLIPIQAGSLQAIRHIIKPSITYTYIPDFSKPVLGQNLGYFQEDQAGKLYDKFQRSTIGGTRASESQSVSISVSNQFQSKREIDDKEVKSDLLTWNMSTAYDFTADSLNLAPIRSSLRSPFLKMLNLDISMTHDFYAWDKVARRKVDRMLSFPRLARMNASTTFKFSGSRFVPLPEDFTADTAAVSDTLDFVGEEEISIRRKIVKPKVSSGKFWDASLSFRYSLTPTLQPEKRETFWMNGNVTTSIGPGWNLRYTTRFNLVTRELVHHDLQLHRELHCWEFAFSWTPSGPGRGFLLRINVQDTDLQDIKYESKGGTQNLIGF